MITLRAFLLGLLTCAGILYFIIQVGQGMKSGSFVKSQYPIVAFMPFVLWLFLNTALKRLWPYAALRQGELLAIFTMLWVVGTMPQLGWVTYWTSTVAGPAYHATLENRWADLLFDYLPWHVLPDTSQRVTEMLWLGMPEGMDIPWDGWIRPIAHWLGVSVAMVVFGFCLMMLFQKQWQEGEKLTFPLAQMPRDLTKGFDGSGRMPELFRSRLFWIGFLAVFLVYFYNILTYFTPGMTAATIYLERYSWELGEFHSLTVRVLPLVMAFTYLCPVDILASLIFFHLIYMVKYGFMRRFGVSLGEHGEELKSWEILSLEANGALFLVAFWSIWMARGHLRWAWRLVISGNGTIEDVARYRCAITGMVLSGLFVIFWGVNIGMDIVTSILAFALIALTYFVTVKLIAATGFGPTFPKHDKGTLVVEDFIGSSRLSPRNLVGFKIFSSHAFFGGGRVQTWTAIAHHLHLFSLRRQPVWVPTLILATFVFGFLVAAGNTISLAYNEGGALHLSNAGHDVYDQMVKLLDNPKSSGLAKRGVWLWGFFEAGVLAFMRGRFHWFPFHPIGIALQNSLGTVVYWFSLLLVLIIKAILLRYGGVQAFVDGKPFFYGLGVGYVTGVAASLCVDLIWFPIGHSVHGW
jgi:hypothetical protein